MYYKISDFIEDWKYESGSTLKVLSNLTDESLTKKINDEIRTPGRLAWHIVTSVVEMTHRTELTFESVDENTPTPSSVKEIVDEYRRASENMIKEITEKWNDETLKQRQLFAKQETRRSKNLRKQKNFHFFRQPLSHVNA